MTGIKNSNHWDDKKKVETVTTWLATGKLSLTEAITGVPKATITNWKREPWWADLVHEIQNESDQQLDTKLQKIVDKSLDVVLDRIEHGDFVLNSKTGEITRIPTKLKDVHRVSVDLIDKRDLIRNRERVHVEVQAVDDYLKRLAVQFADFVKKRAPVVIEGESSAVHEKREEGLQEGSSPVHLSTGSN